MAERLTTERLKFFAMSLAQRELARVHGLTGGLGTLATSIAEENAMASELLGLRREVEQLSADRYAEQQRREAAEARIAELEAALERIWLEAALERICFINNSPCDEHCEPDCAYASARKLLRPGWEERECERLDAEGEVQQ